METMESNADLYLGTQHPDQSTDEFYKTFTAQVDTIKSNIGSTRSHNGLYNKHMVALWGRDLFTADSLAAMSPAEKTALEKRLQKEATERSYKEYLACLFLLLADGERFKPVMMELSNNYLLGKQE